MNLVNPAALFLAALAVPIVAFYILKVRLRRMPVSTLLFWEQIFEEKKPRSLWQRLRHLSRCSCNWPSWRFWSSPWPTRSSAGSRPARRLVLVVDNSASMNASDVPPSRLEAAKAEGRRLIDGLRLGDELAIIAAGAQPQVVCGPTDHQRTLREALDIDRARRRTDPRRPRRVALARRLLSGSDKITEGRSSSPTAASTARPNWPARTTSS